MRKLFRNIGDNFILLIKGSCLGILISIAPIALVHHNHIYLFLSQLNWLLIVFFIVCVTTGGVLSLFIPHLPASPILNLGLFYLFCYTACAALCQKLNLTVFSFFAPITSQVNDNSYFPWINMLGLLLICLAAIIQIKAAVKNAEKSKHPFYISWLLFMFGIPLLFNVWLPLIALPGAWVVTKWFD